MTYLQAFTILIIAVGIERVVELAVSKRNLKQPIALSICGWTQAQFRYLDEWLTSMTVCILQVRRGLKPVTRHH